MAKKDKLLNIVKKRKVVYPNAYAVVYKIGATGEHRIKMEITFSLEDAIESSTEELVYEQKLENERFTKDDIQVVSWEYIPHASLVSRLSKLKT